MQLPWAVYLPLLCYLAISLLFGEGGMGGFLSTNLCQVMLSLGGQVLRQLFK